MKSITIDLISDYTLYCITGGMCFASWIARDEVYQVPDNIFSELPDRSGWFQCMSIACKTLVADSFLYQVPGQIDDWVSCKKVIGGHPCSLV